MTSPAPESAVPIPKSLATKSLAELVVLAQAATAQMQTTVDAIAPDETVKMSSASFAAITALMGQLATSAAARAGEAGRQERTLSRIADLDIRDGRELFELGAWKKIAEEFQSIAQEAVNGPGSAQSGRRRVAADTRAPTGGLEH